MQWSSQKDGAVVLYKIGPYQLDLQAARIDVSRDGGDDSWMPRMMVGQGDLSLTGVPGFVGHAEARFVVSKLDPQATAPSIVLTSYSGGAHCCTDVQIATRSAGGWTVAHLGQFDSEPLARPPQDIDGDGATELQIPDSRFAYAFDSYGGSYMPIRIFGIRSGKAVDLSAQPAFRGVFEAEIKRTEPLCRQHQSGACAAYLADASRLGRAAEGWRVVKAAASANFRWYPNKRCGDQIAYDRCPAGQERPVADYATGLRLFLNQMGYPVPPPP